MRWRAQHTGFVIGATVGGIFNLTMGYGPQWMRTWVEQLTCVSVVLCVPGLLCGMCTGVISPDGFVHGREPIGWALYIGGNALFGGSAGWLAVWLFTRRPQARDGGKKCGYNLTGNVSGICPECGTPIASDPRSSDM